MPDFRTHWWDQVQKTGADGPHHVQMAGFFEERADIVAAIMASLPPVSKLTYRFDEQRLSPPMLLSRLLADLPEPVLPHLPLFQAL